jgi:peroxiredoxin Q/BCP
MPNHIMRLEQNVIAPVFNEKDIYDREINLQDYKGRKLLIAFFRHAGCPFCNLRVHYLSKAHESLKAAGLDMIFFFESKAPVILRSTFHRGTSPIPIISDPTKKWYDAYGLESSGAKSAISHMTSFVQTTFKAKSLGLPVHMMASGESISTMPAEFLLDKGLIVKRVHYSERLNDRLEIRDIEQFARG